ncbi:E3 ubiquitin-protein ligase RNF183-like [Carcharodon carcharias]|uniref:E3 ubiquitin-protein ligase RNF183-like n=1 Tax=Carcharodon carcharias TaxID=13397 RepID=UPI001B7E5DC5|nr:E3 ubiquitin-protein ligase RNF183-like [Carcharodon carcharias]
MPGERECAICYCPYTRGSRTPRVLPCQHTFCSECLQVLVSLVEPEASGLCQLPCPLCRQLAQTWWEADDLPFPVDPALGELLPAEGPQEEGVEAVGTGTPSALKRGAKRWVKSLKRRLGLQRPSQSNVDAICVNMHDMALMASSHLM